MEPYIGQIMQVGFSFAPQGWAQCLGQIMSIQQNTALFSLLGTTYGGNGTQTFALPNLGGRTAVGTGQSPGTSNYAWGQVAGTETTTLTQQQMPVHTHVVTLGTAAKGSLQGQTGVADATLTSVPATGSQLANTYLSGSGSAPAIYAPYNAGGTAVNLGGVNLRGTADVTAAGGSQPFSLLQPYLALTTIIALQGIFPSRN